MPASMKHLIDKKLNITSLLARWKDGLYYTAAIVKCEKSRGRCLVCFEDGSELWVHKRDLHIQLTADQIGEPDDIVCCVCDEDDSDEPNVIVLCDICNQAYHQKCHRPEIDKSVLDSSDDHDWICATCSYILNQSNPSKLVNSLQKQHQEQPKQSDQPTKDKVKAKPVPSTASVIPRQELKEAPIKSETTTIPSTASAAPITKGPTIATPKQAPYYPLSGQMRAATSSTAALASMTASSASVVGSPAGRTKQDLVNQSNRSSQRQQQLRQPGNVEVISTPPVKHAVRKSSVNYPMPPVRQSALPTATRSVPSSVGPPAKMPRLISDTVPTSITPIGSAISLTPTATAKIVDSKPQYPQQATVSNNTSDNLKNQGSTSGSTVRLIPRQSIISPQGNQMNKSLNQHIPTAGPRIFEVTHLTPPLAAAVARTTPTSNSKSPATMSHSSNSPIALTSPSNNHGRSGIVVVDGSGLSLSQPQQTTQGALSDGSTRDPHPTVIVSADSKRKDNSTS